ncbi:MAG TPA: DUF3558 family protein [Pseudonocardiaceae bacterium]
MTRSVKRMVAMSILSAAAVGTLAACGGGGGSNLQPGGTSTTTSGAGSTTSASGGAASDRWFNSVQACSLVDQATLTQLGYTSPGKVVENNDFENQCSWKNDTSELALDLVAQDYNHITSLGGQLSNLTVAGRPAVQDDITASGICMISLEATKGSQALIHVDLLQSASLAPCDIATQAATAVVSKLPKLSG